MLFIRFQSLNLMTIVILIFSKEFNFCVMKRLQSKLSFVKNPNYK